MKKLTIFYDNFCPNCTKFTHTIKKLDWLHLLEIKKLRDENITNVHKEIDIKLAGQQMASFVNKWQYGYFSLFSIFARIPILWIFAPLFFILKIESWPIDSVFFLNSSFQFLMFQTNN